MGLHKGELGMQKFLSLCPAILYWIVDVGDPGDRYVKEAMEDSIEETEREREIDVCTFLTMSFIYPF
jgi:hypothetical protein